MDSDCRPNSVWMNIKGLKLFILVIQINEMKENKYLLQDISGMLNKHLLQNYLEMSPLMTG